MHAQFIRAGQQDLTKTLTAALKRSINVLLLCQSSNCLIMFQKRRCFISFFTPSAQGQVTIGLGGLQDSLKYALTSYNLQHGKQ